MNRRLILVVGILSVLLLTGCGGGGGGSSRTIDIYVGVWQGPIMLEHDYEFDWRLIFTDAGTDLDGNPQYSYEVWDLEGEATGHEYLWGTGYAPAYPSGLVNFYVYHTITGELEYRFQGYISGNTFTGEMFGYRFLTGSYDFVFTRQ